MISFSEFLNLFRQGKVSAKSHMKNLIEMAMIDGHFDTSEYDLLKKIAKKHNISQKKLKEIQDELQDIEFEVPENEEEKFTQLYDLVHMMTIDDYIDKEEVKLCEIFAKKFGYNENNVGELVGSIADNIKHGQDRKETLRRVDWLME